MGRLTKAKIDEIGKLREQGYTQKETAEKAEVHLRTVRKYDPLREKPAMPARQEADELEKAIGKLAAKGLIEEDSRGVRITYLGKKVHAKFEQLEMKAMLNFIADAHRGVRVEEIEGYLDEISEELLEEALGEVTRHRSSSFSL